MVKATDIIKSFDGLRRVVLLAPLAVAANACQTATSFYPAVLVSNDRETMAAVNSALAEALDVSKVTLGAGDPTVEPFISVLPPRPSQLEGRSTVKPAIFDIVISDHGCALVQRGSGKASDLARRYCRLL